MKISTPQRGFFFIMVIMVSLLSMGYAFSGPQLPARMGKLNKNLVVPISPTGIPEQNALQMMSFGGATITPYPTRPEANTPACGEIATPPTGADPTWTCTGNTATQPSSDSYYIPTQFGCSGGSTDPNGNCTPGCPVDQIPECAGLQGRACEEKLGAFAANADQYGCNTKLKITNSTTGKAVIVRVIDKGPQCSVQKSGRGKIGLSKLAYDAIDANNATVVKVEKAFEGITVGVMDACPTPTPNP